MILLNLVCIHGFYPLPDDSSLTPDTPFFLLLSLRKTLTELQMITCLVWLGSQRPELGMRALGFGSLGGQGPMTEKENVMVQSSSLAK